MPEGSEAGVDPRSLTGRVDGLARALEIIEETWQATVERAQRLPEAALHENVNDEWSFVETQRHLVFVSDAWVRRAILGETAAYHRLAMPPDFLTGRPDPDATVDVADWGIDIHAQPSLDDVLEVRSDRMRTVRDVVAGLEPDGLRRVCPHNPAPGFPPVTALPVGTCLEVVVREEWAHHGFATRDLAVLEQRA